MPLVVPGITSQPGNKTEEWQNKLVGKKLSDSEHTETVSLSLNIYRSLVAWLTDIYSSFARRISPRSTASLAPGRW